MLDQVAAEGWLRIIDSSGTQPLHPDSAHKPGCSPRRDTARLPPQPQRGQVRVADRDHPPSWVQRAVPVRREVVSVLPLAAQRLREGGSRGAPARAAKVALDDHRPVRGRGPIRSQVLRRSESRTRVRSPRRHRSGGSHRGERRWFRLTVPQGWSPRVPGRPCPAPGLTTAHRWRCPEVIGGGRDDDDARPGRRLALASYVPAPLAGFAPFDRASRSAGPCQSESCTRSSAWPVREGRD